MCYSTASTASTRISKFTVPGARLASDVYLTSTLRTSRGWRAVSALATRSPIAFTYSIKNFPRPGTFPHSAPPAHGSWRSDKGVTTSPVPGMKNRIRASTKTGAARPPVRIFLIRKNALLLVPVNMLPKLRSPVNNVVQFVSLSLQTSIRSPPD